MSILFVQHWDVMPGKFDEYGTFISNYYNPGLAKLGIRLVGGYYVKVGEGPRVVAVATVDEADNLRRAISSREYRELSARLSEHVWKYSNKIYVPVGRTEKAPYVIQTGVFKLTHYYNVLHGMEEEHVKFVREEVIPTMEQLNIPVTGAWRMAIGSGPRMLAECTGRNLAVISEAIQSDQYRKAARTLKNKYTTDYSSRILAPTGRIEIPYLLSEMMKNF
jgi:hypothetical protein